MYDTTLVFCPSSHPFPFSDGRKCCAYDVECNGQLTLFRSSDCCYDNNFVWCPNERHCEYKGSGITENSRRGRTYRDGH